MNSILIGDIGSTHAQWAWLSRDREVTFTTEGYNPVQHASYLLHHMLDEVKAQCPVTPTEVFYYGTGIISDAVRATITSAVQSSFGTVTVSCESDMLASARTVSVGQQSVVCILGTGSNSCLFDGRQIIRQIPSLGFPLGDEGGGADIGRALVRMYYYGLLTGDVVTELAERLPQDRADFLRDYNAHPAPNRMLATLVPIVARHTGMAIIRQMLKECFRTFARVHVVPYGVDGPIHMTGGIAGTFHDIIVEVLTEEALTPGVLNKSPLPGLIAFHRKREL